MDLESTLKQMLGGDTEPLPVIAVEAPTVEWSPMPFGRPRRGPDEPL